MRACVHVNEIMQQPARQNLRSREDVVSIS